MISSFLVFSLAFGGGSRGEAAEPRLPGSIPGWEATSYSSQYSAAELHKYLNGGAAKYLAYAIQGLHVQEYRRDSDGFVAVAELYATDSPRNAFGVYSCDRGGAHPEGLGEEASYEGGLLQFWQGSNYLRVYPADATAREAQAADSAAVLDLGRALSATLRSRAPRPGAVRGAPTREAARGAPVADGTAAGERADADTAGSALLPEIVLLMPEDDLVEDSLCYFHAQVSLNSIYYLSDENLLHLSDKTDAVSAEYKTPSGGTARVIAVCYPETRSVKGAYGTFCTAYLDPTTAPLPAEAFEDEQWTSTGEGEWLYAGFRERVLTLVLEAPREDEAIELGRKILASAGRCGQEDNQ